MGHHNHMSITISQWEQKVIEFVTIWRHVRFASLEKRFRQCLRSFIHCQSANTSIHPGIGGEGSDWRYKWCNGNNFAAAFDCRKTSFTKARHCNAVVVHVGVVMKGSNHHYDSIRLYVCVPMDAYHFSGSFKKTQHGSSDAFHELLWDSWRWSLQPNQNQVEV